MNSIARFDSAGLIGRSPAYAVVAESPADIAAREALLDRAMGPGRKRKSSEKLRRGRRPSEGLAFVARAADGRVVGTVRLWDVAVGDNGRPALLLGPLAVDPSLKNAGIGSALMRHAIGEAERLGHGAILLVGDAPYYARFGFSAEKTGSLAMPGPYERHRLLALELQADALAGAQGVMQAAGRGAGKARQRAAAALFDAVANAVTRYSVPRDEGSRDTPRSAPGLSNRVGGLNCTTTATLRAGPENKPSLRRQRRPT